MEKRCPRASYIWVHSTHNNLANQSKRKYALVRYLCDSYSYILFPSYNLQSGLVHLKITDSTRSSGISKQQHRFTIVAIQVSYLGTQSQNEIQHTHLLSSRKPRKRASKCSDNLTASDHYYHKCSIDFVTRLTRQRYHYDNISHLHALFVCCLCQTNYKNWLLEGNYSVQWRLPCTHKHNIYSHLNFYENCGKIW